MYTKNLPNSDVGAVGRKSVVGGPNDSKTSESKIINFDDQSDVGEEEVTGVAADTEKTNIEGTHEAVDPDLSTNAVSVNTTLPPPRRSTSSAHGKFLEVPGAVTSTVTVNPPVIVSPNNTDVDVIDQKNVAVELDNTRSSIEAQNSNGTNINMSTSPQNVASGLSISTSLTPRSLSGSRSPLNYRITKKVYTPRSDCVSNCSQGHRTSRPSTPGGQSVGSAGNVSSAVSASAVSLGTSPNGEGSKTLLKYKITKRCYTPRSDVGSNINGEVNPPPVPAVAVVDLCDETNGRSRSRGLSRSPGSQRNRSRSPSLNYKITKTVYTPRSQISERSRSRSPGASRGDEWPSEENGTSGQLSNRSIGGSAASINPIDYGRSPLRYKITKRAYSPRSLDNEIVGEKSHADTAGSRPTSPFVKVSVTSAEDVGGNGVNQKDINLQPTSNVNSPSPMSKSPLRYKITRRAYHSPREASGDTKQESNAVEKSNMLFSVRSPSNVISTTKALSAEICSKNRIVPDVVAAEEPNREIFKAGTHNAAEPEVLKTGSHDMAPRYSIRL